MGNGTTLKRKMPQSAANFVTRRLEHPINVDDYEIGKLRKCVENYDLEGLNSQQRHQIAPKTAAKPLGHVRV